MNDETHNEDRTFEILSKLIDDVFSTHYNKEKKMQAQPITPAPDKEHFPNLYESIEDYTTKTGKRFRMTKNQKARGLSREEAFSEMYLGGTN
jgi:hypothetical protein